MPAHRARGKTQALDRSVTVLLSRFLLIAIAVCTFRFSTISSRMRLIRKNPAASEIPNRALQRESHVSRRVETKTGRWLIHQVSVRAETKVPVEYIVQDIPCWLSPGHLANAR